MDGTEQPTEQDLGGVLDDDLAEYHSHVEPGNRVSIWLYWKLPRWKKAWRRLTVTNFRFGFGQSRAAYEMEHAVVVLVIQFCGEVDQTLRKSLGSRYDHWEKSEDQELPDDVVF
jgi:hypothetical protein